MQAASEGRDLLEEGDDSVTKDLEPAMDLYCRAVSVENHKEVTVRSKKCRVIYTTIKNNLRAVLDEMNEFGGEW